MLLAKLVALYSVVYLLSTEIRKHYSNDVLNSFLLLFLFMPVFIFTSRNMWNPSWVVLFNCLQFYFLLKFTATSRQKYIYFAAITAVLGMQVHLSTFIAYLAFGISVLSLKHVDIKVKKIQASIFALITLWLSCWFIIDFVPQFNHQINSLYGLSSFYLNRISDLAATLTLSLTEIQDYDLFSLYFKTFSELNLINKNLMIGIAGFLYVAYLALFVASLAAVIREYIKSRRMPELFFILYNLLFLISILLFKNKANIPYRYGLAIFPMQFFTLSYGIYLIANTKKFYSLFKLLITLTVCFYMYFNLKIFAAQSLLGRAHHTNNDNLELTLKNKEFIYKFLKKNVNLEGDPFNYLHGRTANKFRLKEMNWEQTTPYYSLYRLTNGKKFNFNESLSQSGVNDNWLVSLKNLKELREDSSQVLKITELSSEAFPRNLKIHYLDKNRQEIQQLHWDNTSLIMPAAFGPDLREVAYLKLKFDMDTSTYRFINLLVDDNEEYRFAYPPMYEVLEFKAANTSIQPLHTYRGYFLVQNQYIFETKKSVKTDIEIEIALKYKIRNFSRIDIFSTDRVLPQEELFPKLTKNK